LSVKDVPQSGGGSLSIVDKGEGGFCRQMWMADILLQKLKNFRNYGVSARTRGGDWNSADKRRSIFRFYADFYGRPLSPIRSSDAETYFREGVQLLKC